jgi:hypothetical protein
MIVAQQVAELLLRAYFGLACRVVIMRERPLSEWGS